MDEEIVPAFGQQDDQNRGLEKKSSANTKQCRLRRKQKQKDSGLGHSCTEEQRGELFANSPHEQFRLGRHLSKQLMDPSYNLMTLSSLIKLCILKPQ
ncbi:hypothetical protein CEXT_755981 [Caerostris extrusa]|uniref:Uncharacterized protein n=1 Tax=Caerostris extrusa TaxID=172846 RepID=A0AAV4R3R1_CAEEX|nr:hypothetical protein CEXT_755981 [Caerostris extrusa]